MSDWKPLPLGGIAPRLGAHVLMSGTSAAVDDDTDALLTLTLDEYYIHAGQSFKAGYADAAMVTDDTISMLFTTPNTDTRIHWTLSALATGVATVVVYEDPTINANGTAVTRWNRDRNSATTSELLVYHTPTIGANGTSMASQWMGGSGFKTTIGDDFHGQSKFILEQNEQYLVILTAGADAIKCKIGACWWEV